MIRCAPPFEFEARISLACGQARQWPRERDLHSPSQLPTQYFMRVLKRKVDSRSRCEASWVERFSAAIHASEAFSLASTVGWQLATRRKSAAPKIYHRSVAYIRFWESESISDMSYFVFQVRCLRRRRRLLTLRSSCFERRTTPSKWAPPPSCPACSRTWATSRYVDAAFTVKFTTFFAHRIRPTLSLSAGRLGALFVFGNSNFPTVTL